MLSEFVNLGLGLGLVVAGVIVIVTGLPIQWLESFF